MTHKLFHLHKRPTQNQVNTFIMFSFMMRTAIDSMHFLVGRHPEQLQKTGPINNLKRG